MALSADSHLDPLGKNPKITPGRENKMSQYECLDILEVLQGWLAWQAGTRINLLVLALVGWCRKRAPTSDTSSETQWSCCRLVAVVWKRSSRPVLRTEELTKRKQPLLLYTDPCECRGRCFWWGGALLSLWRQHGVSKKTHLPYLPQL